MRVVQGCGDAVSMSLRWVGGLVYGVGGVGCIGSDKGKIQESAGCTKCEGGTRVVRGCGDAVSASLWCHYNGFGVGWWVGVRRDHMSVNE